MKYISLKCLMRAYARKAKEHGRYKRLLPGSSCQPGRPSRIFQISSHLEHREEGEQVVKTIQPCWSEIFGLSMRAVPPSLNVFPILELEWCRETEQIPEEEFQVLEQVAYGVLLSLLAQDLGRDIYNAGFTKKDLWDRHYRVMEAWDITVDADELSDAPEILSHVEVPFLSTRNIKTSSWYANLPCGGSFGTLLRFFAREAEEASVWGETKAKSIYASLPFLVPFFLFDKKEWKRDTTHVRGTIILDLRQTAADLYEKTRNLRRAAVSRNIQGYTYCQCSELTAMDFDLLEGALARIKADLEDLVSRIGVLPYNRYRHYRTEIPVKAVVRLGGIHRNWDDELEKSVRKEEVPFK